MLWFSAMVTFFMSQGALASQGGLVQKDWRSVYEKASPSIYLIQCGTRKGAGFLYRDKQHILTTLSVSGCGRTIWLKRQGEKKWIAVKMKGYMQKYDIALLKASQPLPDTPLPRSKPDSTRIGQQVAAIGHPYKSFGPLDQWRLKVLSWSLTTGVVGRVTKEHVQVNMSVISGFAGAPLLNQHGHVIGLLTDQGPKRIPIGVVARHPLINKLFANPTPRQGWPFFSFGAQFDARFSYALGDPNATRISPSNQELRVDLIFWDQLLWGLYAGFDLLSLSTNLDLSFLIGTDINYRFLMPREVRPYLNYVSLGLGAMAMQVKLFVGGQENNNNFDNFSLNGLFRVTFWGGMRIHSIIGQFSVGVFFDVEDIQNPVLSVSWGLGG